MILRSFVLHASDRPRTMSHEDPRIEFTEWLLGDDDNLGRGCEKVSETRFQKLGFRNSSQAAGSELRGEQVERALERGRRCARVVHIGTSVVEERVMSARMHVHRDVLAERAQVGFESPHLVG